MDRHPGGPTTILAWAGKDASKFFNDIHKGVKMLGWEFRVLRVLRGLGFQGVKMLGWGFRGLRCRGFIKIGDPDGRTKQSE